MEKTQKVSIQPGRASQPEPNPAPSWWMDSLTRLVGENPERTWGERMIRVASDMMVVCDQDLTILYHNRAFLKGLGHSKGTYVGQAMVDFIPLADRAEAQKAFNTLVGGKTSGMRIAASLLTRNGASKVEARVIRTRRRNDQCYLYFVIRDVSAKEQELERIAQNSIETVFENLSIAAFRTDRHLKVTHAFGGFWQELGINTLHLKGAELADPGCHLTPRFLHDIDYCDAMAGQTYQGLVEYRGHNLSVTIEPFIDQENAGKVVGTVGIIREAKELAKTEIAATSQASHLDMPAPEEYTAFQRIPDQIVKRVAAEQAAVDRIRSDIRPRPMTPRAETATVKVALVN